MLKFHSTAMIQIKSPFTLTQLIEAFGKPDLEELFKVKLSEFIELKNAEDTLHRERSWVKIVQTWMTEVPPGQQQAPYAILLEVMKLKHEQAVEKAQKQIRYWERLLQGVQDGFKYDTETLKQVPLELVIGEAIRSSNGRSLWLCPLHEEKTPSFTGYANNTFYCFGCGSGGDVIELVQAIHKCDFTTACKRLTALQ